MKKLLTSILVLTVAACFLAGCGKPKPKDDKGGKKGDKPAAEKTDPKKAEK